MLCFSHQVGVRKSGPALTLIIETAAGDKLDVDLVPAFRFSIEYIKDHPRIDEDVKKSHGVRTKIHTLTLR